MGLDFLDFSMILSPMGLSAGALAKAEKSMSAEGGRVPSFDPKQPGWQNDPDWRRFVQAAQDSVVIRKAQETLPFAVASRNPVQAATVRATRGTERPLQAGQPVQISERSSVAQQHPLK